MKKGFWSVLVFLGLGFLLAGSGRIVLEGPAEDLAQREEIKKAYLGE